MVIVPAEFLGDNGSMPEHASIAAIESLIGKVRRRSLLQLLLEQTSYAAIFGMAGVILLLLLGTQILNWYWPVLVFAAMFAIGCYRFLKSNPTLYQIAQSIDRRLGLHDALSTAYFFRAGQGEIEAAQRQAAQSVVPGIDPAAASPFHLPRTAYAAAILTTAAFAMLAFRYGILHNLDLRQPLVAALGEIFHSPTSQRAAAAKKLDPRYPAPLEGEGVSLDENTVDQEMIKERANQGEIASADIPDVNDLTMGRNVDGKGDVEGKTPNDASEEPGAKGEKGDADEDADPSAGEGAQGQQQQGKSNTPPPNGAKDGNKNSDSQGDNASLLDKMRDALNNMMTKLKIPNKPGENQQTAQAKQSKQAGQGQKQDKKGQQQEGQKGEGQQAQDQQGDQEGEGQQAQSAQGKSGDKSGDQKASQDAKSGVGKSDGDKDVKYAEQLSAMGKISEILGKRAQNIQGEVMMEVQSGKQQLRTQYTSQQGAHQESSGEIHRDEVPLQHQHYVQQYFEEVRKTAPK
jgi:hypothetical protein